MTNVQMSALLYQRMKGEQDRYRAWLLSQPPSEILNHACEYSVREDIVVKMGEVNLTDAQAKELLKSPAPLADVYEEWNKTDTHHMEDVQEIIAVCADRAVHAEKEKGQREVR